jgi:filamentous hemagglutinin
MVEIDAKIAAQLAQRGWEEHEVRDLANTSPGGTSVDNTAGKNDPATVYGSPPNNYIVVNDVTGQVVQVSNRRNPAWVPDNRIRWNS